MTTPEATTRLADRSLLLTQLAFSGAPDDRFWNRFELGWRTALQAAWSQVVSHTPQEASERLRLEHHAQARPDWNRIHPSWWLRALKDESPAVQRVVVANAPEMIRKLLQTGLGLSDRDLETELPPFPQALEAALTLWAERLVGDRSDRDDPPVIRAITRLGRNDLAHLIAAAGLVKWILAGAVLPADLAQTQGAATLQNQIEARVQSDLEPIADSLKSQWETDVSRYGHANQDRLGTVGLLTLARLLELIEPYRARWALQHLPYAHAKLIRTLIAHTRPTDPTVLSGEASVLKFTWNLLLEEGWLADMDRDVDFDGDAGGAGS